MRARRRPIRVKAVIRRRDGGISTYVFRWRDPLDGRTWRQRDSGIVGTEANRRAAERAAGELEKELIDSRENTSWEEFSTRYAAEHLPSLAVKSRKMWYTASNSLVTHVAPQLLADVDSDALSRWSTALRKAKLSESSIATYLRTILAALGWAKRPAGLIASVPEVARPERTGRTKHMRGRPLTGEEVDRMIAAAEKVRPADAKRWRRLIRGLDLSGLRLTEALALSWDRSAAVAVYLEGGHPALRFYAEGQKGHRDQFLPITPDFAAWLLRIPAGRRRGRVFRIRQTSGSVGRIISAIGKRANVKAGDRGRFATAHDLRRTFGSRWAPRLSPVELQRLMRHASIETTMKFYVRIDADVLATKLAAVMPVGDKSGDQPHKTTPRKRPSKPT